MTGEDTFFSVVLSIVVPSVVFDTFVASVDVEEKDVSSGAPVVVLKVVALVVVVGNVVVAVVVVGAGCTWM